MNQKIARLKSSKEALSLAKNARRLGDNSLADEAVRRSYELRAQEEGYQTPAEKAIAEALYAYEEEQSRALARKFRAGRTRNMLKEHGPLVAAERMVMKRRPSSGFKVLEDAGREELSFESIVDRYPDEFSDEAVNAARARLSGEVYQGPKVLRTARASRFDDFNDVLVTAQREALRRFDGGKNEVGTWGESKKVEVEGRTKKSGIAFPNDQNPHPALRAQHLSMKFGGRGVIIEWMQHLEDVPPSIYVIAEDGREPAIPMEGLPYGSRSFHREGRRRVAGAFAIEQSQEAIALYVACLAEFAPPNPRAESEPMHRVSSVTAARFTAALAAASLSEKDWRWLTVHYHSQGAVASMEALATLLGYDDYRVGNSQYGAAAGRIAKAIGVDSVELADGPYSQQMQWLTTVVGRNEQGHQQLQLRPALCEALAGLGWSRSEPEEEGEPQAASPGQVQEARNYGLSDTEIRQMMLSRKGQGRFRQDVLRFWGGACAVTGLRQAGLLLASHIKPWKDSDPNERLDGFNGLPLSPNLDKAFDRGLITFGADGGIRISALLDGKSMVALGIHERMKLRLVDSRLEKYLSFHRNIVFEAPKTVSETPSCDMESVSDTALELSPLPAST